MRYVKAKYDESQKDLAYRIYMSDSVYYQGENKRLTKRYYDVLNPPILDTRTADEIAIDIINRLKLEE